MPKYARSFLLLVLWLFSIHNPAIGQTQSNASLSSPDTAHFPLVSLFLDVRGNEGEFIHGVKASNVRLEEDGNLVPIATFEHRYPGVQFVTVINPGRSFALQDSQGVSRYDYLIETLLEWSDRRRGSSIDDLSILVADGPQASHLDELQKFQDALKQIETDIERDIQPNLDILSQAIDIASDPAPRLGMGKAILFITPPLPNGASQSIPDLTSRASQNNIQVNVWMTASEGSYSAEAEEELRMLSQQTGGQFALNTGISPLPDLEAYLQPLRNTYYLEYNSIIRNSGKHQISATIRTPFGELKTAEQNFEINILPPNPAFISPPLEIERNPPEGSSTPTEEPGLAETYLPRQHEFEILVNFPDERVRPLERTALLVNGVLVDENLEPPFERLVWDIHNLTENSEHQVQVEVEDSLGLVGTSMMTRVELRLNIPEPNPWAWFYNNIRLLTLLGILLAGAVLFMALVLSGRIRPNHFQRFGQRRAIANHANQTSQIDQQVSAHRLSRWVNRLHWPRQTNDSRDVAYLNRINETNSGNALPQIVIVDDEITLGSDPDQATFVISDPAIEPIHAKLKRVGESEFHVSDQGTVAGTWLNYSMIPTEGVTVKHGDLIHIGSIGFRLTFRNPKPARKPVITLLNETGSARK